MAAKEQASAKQSLTEKISTKEKVSYGCGDLASNLILVLTSTFVAYFYTDALGLNAAIIGSIMMFSRFADGPRQNEIRKGKTMAVMAGNTDCSSMCTCIPRSEYRNRWKVCLRNDYV